MHTWVLALISSLIFFLIGLFTVSDYGISWDEQTHFRRGQAYVHYFLTGKYDYSDLPEYNLDKARLDKSYHQRSLYQDDSFNLNFYLSGDHDWGHPPLNSILSAFFNFVLYQKLGIAGDIESFHIYNVFISAILVGVVFFWASTTFGKWAGISSAIFLATYPLFFAESHFNIKDPAETAFFTLTIYFLWNGFKQQKRIFIILAAIFAGMAMGTKFNVLFIPLIIIPWLILSNFGYKTGVLKNVFSKKLLPSILFSPVITLAIFFGTWPYLWSNTVERTASIFGYYKDIGTVTHFQPGYIIGIFNTYPLQWILFTTQPIVLLFFVLGFIAIKYCKKEQRNILTLWIVWFLVTVFRVSFSGTSIYGGVRQIMEYIPAMVFISGVGAAFLIRRLKIKFQKFWIFKPERPSFAYLSFCILILTFSIYPIIRLHPNENVYFNFLVGGLKNAVDRNIPSAGNSLGNAYFQGVNWLNKNAEKDAKLALIQASKVNVPISQLRGDIQFSNDYRSGIERKGEYLMELIYNYENKEFHYSWEYVDKLLDPVYEVKVDGAAILKIWKNDLAHTKPEYRKSETNYKGAINSDINGGDLEIDFPQEVLLSRMAIRYLTRPGCVPLKNGYVYTSQDGQNWEREKGIIPFYQLRTNEEISDSNLVYLFAARKAKHIRVETGDLNSCILNKPIVKFVVLE